MYENGIINVKTNSQNPIENFNIKYKFSNRSSVSESNFINLQASKEKEELSDLFYHLYFRKTELLFIFKFQFQMKELNILIMYVYLLELHT